MSSSRSVSGRNQPTMKTTVNTPKGLVFFILLIPYQVRCWYHMTWSYCMIRTVSSGLAVPAAAAPDGAGGTSICHNSKQECVVNRKLKWVGPLSFLFVETGGRFRSISKIPCRYVPAGLIGAGDRKIKRPKKLVGFCCFWVTEKSTQKGRFRSAKTGK